MTTNPTIDAVTGHFLQEDKGPELAQVLIADA